MLRNSDLGLTATLDLTDERAAAKTIAELLVSRLESYRCAQQLLHAWNILVIGNSI